MRLYAERSTTALTDAAQTIRFARGEPVGALDGMTRIPLAQPTPWKWSSHDARCALVTLHPQHGRLRLHPRHVCDAHGRRIAI